MKKVILIGTILAVVIIVFLSLGRSGNMTPFFGNGFTDSQVAECEQAIKDYYMKLLTESASAVERHEVATGVTTVDAHMLKISDRKLQGFVKITSRNPEAQKLGLGEIAIPCEATMGVDSTQWIWKCQR
jgi:hypothetical protein